MIEKAEEHDEIPDELYARKGHQEIEVGINLRYLPTETDPRI